jgi:hypothetical protein
MEDESNMTFDDSQDQNSQSGYTLLIEHNYPIKSSKPLKDLSDEERERARLVASFKDMKNMDYKSKGLWFRVTVIHRGRKIQCERRFKEFEYLRVALQRAFPGCYVPRVITNDLAQISSQLNLGSEIPNSYLEKSKELMCCRAIEGFCDKLRSCTYLLESGKIRLS